MLWFKPRTPPPTLPTVTSEQVTALEARVRALEASETVRNAEHAAMVDQLDRLYKRISARISREQPQNAAATESVLSLRERLGK